MKPSKKLVFFGNERLSSGFNATGAPLLSGLIQNGYQVLAIVAHYEPGQSRKKRELEVAEVAKNYNIPVLLPHKPADIAAQLESYQAEAGILAAYGKIIPQEIINVFPRGIINIHPSLLPKYRGPTPVEQAILDDTRQTGVSIMQLEKQMDAGPVFAQTTVDLNGKETKFQLTSMLLRLGTSLLLQHIDDILTGRLLAQPQDDSKATYCQLIQKKDGLINWQKPAIVLEREIRAYANWPGSRTHLFNQDVIVEEASVIPSELAPGEPMGSAGGILVGSSQNALLITKLRPSGRSSMRAVDFLRGLRT